MANDITIPRRHYDTLIANANQLLRMITVYGETANDEFHSYIDGSADALRAALTDVPGASVWDGQWHDEDVDEEIFRHDTQPDRSGPPVGVRLKHVPTEISVESYMKPTKEENRISAMRALKAQVERQQQPAPQQRGRRDHRRGV